jgi:iron complex outermembrane receptor protein
MSVMKKLPIYLLATIAFLLASFNSFSQETTGKVSGVVTGNERSVEGATVTLLKAKDSSIAKLAVTNKSGNFEIEKVRFGSYLVSIQSVGFEKYYSKKFELASSANSYDLASINLTALNKQLKDVAVTAKKPLVEQKIDRTIINVEASITNVGSSALDVLEKSPGISVDKDGNISLKGKQGVMVLVDGRPTQLGGADLANMLRSMNASQLDQIEIMTNPPAKYDAAGNAGIINIKTKKNKQLGYNGSLSATFLQGFYPKMNESFVFNYRQNKVNLFATISHNYNKSYNTLEIHRRFVDKNTKEWKSNFDQLANMNTEGRSYNAKVGMDYFANKTTTLGIVLNGFVNPRDNSNRNVTDITYSTGTKEQTRALSGSHQTMRNFSTNFNFRKVLDTTGKELTADLDYIVYDSKNNQSMVNSYYDALGMPTFKADTLYGNLPQNIKIYSGRLDYSHPFGKGARFEAGVKSSIVKTDNNAIYDSLQYGQIIHDLNRSNHFVYEENINAAYVNLSGSLSKKLSAQFGLRLENTNAKGNQITQNQAFDRHYTQLFPTAFLQYKSDDKNNFGLNYGRRIRRPNYESLNPFIQFLDRYTYQQGNPNLTPQFSHNIELSHSYRNFVTTTLNYSTTNNIIQQVLEQNEEKNETFVKQSNIAKQRQYGVSVSLNVPFTKWWTSNVNVNAFNNKFEGLVNNTFVTISASTIALNGSQQFKLNKTTNAEISGFWRSAVVDGVFNAKPMGMMSVGFSKQVLKNKGTIRITIRDIFYTQQFRAESKYSNIDVNIKESRDTRVINIGFTYRFSKGKINGNAKKRNGSATEEQGRVGGN